MRNDHLQYNGKSNVIKVKIILRAEGLIKIRVIKILS